MNPNDFAGISDDVPLQDKDSLCLNLHSAISAQKQAANSSSGSLWWKTNLFLKQKNKKKKHLVAQKNFSCLSAVSGADKEERLYTN